MEYKEFIFVGMGKRQFILSQDSVSVACGGSNVTLLLKGLDYDHPPKCHCRAASTSIWFWVRDFNWQRPFNLAARLSL